MNLKLFLSLILFVLFCGITNGQQPKSRIEPTQKLSLPKSEKSLLFQQQAESDTLLWESFEGETIEGWFYDDIDGDGEHWDVFIEDEEYDIAHTGSNGLGVSYNAEGNDDWITSPQIELPELVESITFSFWARSHSPNFPEDFNVLLSTAGSDVTDFTITLESVTNASAEWTQYTYDLTEYKGETVFLAIQYVSVDNWYLCADDFLVVAEQEETGTDDWSKQYITLYNTAEADLMARTGDVDNLGFGWPDGFDPFSGEPTPQHAFPWEPDTEDAPGTDRIMVGSGYDGNPPGGTDGYTSGTSRPDNYPEAITVTYNLQGITINSAVLQIFVDDFQAENWGAEYQVTIDDVRAPFLENIINSLSQTGPIGKLISVNVPNNFLQYFTDGEVSILIDDPVTGAGDGYAIDFVKLLINPGFFSYTGTITGVVSNSENGDPVDGALVSASGIIETTTNASGEFTLSNVPAGINFIEISASGFINHSVNVDLQSGVTESITAELTPVGDLPDILTAEFGPPSSADTWEKFSIELNAETFGVESEVFEQSMQSIKMIRIRTEMHDGDDEGGVDNVSLGNLYSSSFDSSTENWSAMGDGTLGWISSGGVGGGYISISDWASGDWHWAVAPDSLSGDLSSVIGQNFEFHYKTDQPSYSAIVEFHTGETKRIVLSADKQELAPGETTQVKVTLVPQPDEDITVSLSSSDSDIISIPESVTISAGNSSATITVEAGSEIDEATSAVITASSSGYSTSRLTLNVSEPSGPSDAIVSTSAGGYWHEPETWIGNVLPTESDNVVIDGPVVILENHGSPEMVDLTINEDGTLKGEGAGGMFDSGILVVHIYGDLTNYGLITDGDGAEAVRLQLHGDLFNDGRIDSHRLLFYGAEEQTISMSENGVFEDLITIAEADISSPVIAGSDLIFTNCTFFTLRDWVNGGYEPGTLVIPEDSGYEIIFDNTDVSYVNIEGNNNSIRGTNESEFDDQNIFSDLYLYGEITIDGKTTFAGDSVMVMDTLSGNPLYDTIRVESEIINHGLIPYKSPALIIQGNLTNFGEWENGQTYISGTDDQYVSMSENSVFSRDLILRAEVEGATDYQWQKNGNDLAGATGVELVLKDLDSDDNGAYICTTGAGDSRSINLDIGIPGLVADFASDITTGASPLTVQFTDLSEGNPEEWKWYFGDDISGMADSYNQNPEFTFYEDQPFTVTLIISRGTKSDTLVKEGYIVTGFEAVSAGLSVDIYPNPVDEKLRIAINQSKFDGGLIEISDLFGRKVFEKRIDPGRQEQVVNLSALPMGIYLVKLKSADKIFVQKIVKE